MLGLIREGRWECDVDGKGRFPFPAKIRDEFGTEGTWAREPEGLIVLYPTETWRQKVAGAKKPQKFRERWDPFDTKLDSRGRMTIPLHFREKLGRKIILRSIRKYLKVRGVNGKQEVKPSASKTPRVFRDFPEAKKYRDEGKKILYFSQGGGWAEGQFDPKGGFFTFKGRYKSGTFVSLTAPHHEFYPGE